MKPWTGVRVGLRSILATSDEWRPLNGLAAPTAAASGAVETNPGWARSAPERRAQGGSRRRLARYVNNGGQQPVPVTSPMDPQPRSPARRCASTEPRAARPDHDVSMALGRTDGRRPVHKRQAVAAQFTPVAQVRTLVLALVTGAAVRVHAEVQLDAPSRPHVTRERVAQRLGLRPPARREGARTTS